MLSELLTPDIFIEAALRTTINHNENLVIRSVLTVGVVALHAYVTNKKMQEIYVRLNTLEGTKHNGMFPLNERVIGGYKFGERTWYTSKHLGTDYRARYVPLYAPFDGEIVAELKGVQAGLAIHFVPDHDNVTMRFLHLSEFKAPKGRVTKGQLIAITGNTGFLTTGAHLHLDITVGRSVNINDFSRFIDPEGYNWNWEPPTSELPPVVPEAFNIVITGKLGANARNEPNLASGVFQTLKKGDIVPCNGVVQGQSVSGNTTWYKTKRSGKYISATVSAKQ